MDETWIVYETEMREAAAWLDVELAIARGLGLITHLGEVEAAGK